MNVDDLRLLFAYNDWANGRILAAASGLRMAELRAPALPDPGYGTLLGSIVHILDAEYAWRSLLQEGTWAGELTPDDFATLEDLAATWRTEAAAMRAYLATLTDADMVGIVRYEVEEGRMPGARALALPAARGQPRHLSPRRSGGPADRPRPLARRARLHGLSVGVGARGELGGAS